MSVVDRLRGVLSRRDGGGVDADVLIGRVAALKRFIRAAEGHVPEPALVTARTVVDRAGERLALSKAHTVVALAGATGSGKSSLFNALSRLQLSRVGVRRPTTGVAHACVWGTKGAGPLLDWLGVPPNRRFARESALDADDEVSLRGLVLLDLPDFDSVEESHRIEVDRLLRLVDLVVWVMDPQKYADKVVHRQYLQQFSRHRDSTVVVLNQADRLSRADAERCVADLRRLLEADGLDGVPAFSTSAKGQPGLDQLRTELERTVAERQAALQRLGADVASAVDELRPLVAATAADDRVDRASAQRLTDALAAAAGVPAVAEATERAYRHRAAASLGWPVVRWLRRLRPDPLRRLHLGTGAGSGGSGGSRAIGPGAGAGAGSGPRGAGGGGPAVDAPPSVLSLPESTAAQRAAVALASRTVADQASAGLPEPWPAAVLAAARSRLHDVPDALDAAIGSVDLGVSRPPMWWRLVGALQWLGAAAALAGLAWLAVRYVFFFLGLPELPGPRVGQVPLPTVLLFGGLLFGLLLGTVVRPFAGTAAKRARARAERRLRAATALIASEYIIGPIGDVLTAYTDAREALSAAAAER